MPEMTLEERACWIADAVDPGMADAPNGERPEVHKRALGHLRAVDAAARAEVEREQEAVDAAEVEFWQARVHEAERRGREAAAGQLDHVREDYERRNEGEALPAEYFIAWLEQQAAAIRRGPDGEEG